MADDVYKIIIIRRGEPASVVHEGRDHGRAYEIGVARAQAAGRGELTRVDHVRMTRTDRWGVVHICGRWSPIRPGTEIGR